LIFFTRTYKQPKGYLIFVQNNLNGLSQFEKKGLFVSGETEKQQEAIMHRDRASGAGFVLMGLGTGLSASHLSLGTPAQPGPGLWPFVLSVALVGLGSIQCATAPASGAGEARGISVRVWLTVGNLLVYSLVVEQIGFIVMTAALIGFQLWIVERKGWRIAVGVAVVATAASYFVFGWILNVQLPSGFLFLRLGL
jgi:hypothetical protein